MNDWQERVILEREDLRIKGDKLDQFMSSPEARALEGEQLAWLYIQANAMLQYAIALDARIEDFQK